MATNEAIFKVVADTSQAITSLNSFKNTLVGAGAAFAAAFAIEDIIGKAIDAAIEQEEAINKLNIALKSTGKFTDTASKDLQEYASSLQKTTKYSDDAIESSMALLQTMANLDSQGLKKATKAALDLSTAYGIDLESATRLIGKAAEGNVVSLNKMGIEVEKGTTDAITFAKALEAIESRAGGSSEKSINTFSGALAQSKNAFGEVLEEVGNWIIKNDLIISTVKASAVAFDFLANAIKNTREQQEKLNSQNPAERIKANEEIRRSQLEMADLSKQTIDEVLAYEKEQTASANADLEQAQFEHHEILKNNALSKEAEKFNLLRELRDADKLADQQRRGEHLVDSQIAMDAEFQQLQLNLGNVEAAKIISNVNQLSEDGKYAEAKKALLEGELKSKKSAEEREVAFKKEMMEKKYALYHQEVGFAEAAATAIATVSGASSYVILAIAKAAAIANIMINDAQARMAATAAAASAAASSGPLAPVVFGTHLAAYQAIITAQTALAIGTVAAQTVTQVATMQKSKAKDGIDSVPEDNMTFLLSKGERVVGARLNKDLTDFLNTDSERSNSGDTYHMTFNVTGQVGNSDETSQAISKSVLDAFEYLNVNKRGVLA